MTAPSVLDLITSPADLKNLDTNDLKALADDLRQEMISIVSKTGGHLGASLGVVDLTVALHAVFQTPDDRLIWDVSHQSYAHKLLTGRRESMKNLRQGGGASGFTRRVESDYDPFGAAHAGTSISAALGFAVARDLKGEKRNVIAVIGDGSMSAGMAYEAMNNAGSMGSRLLVILNDNDMSIAPPVGAMSAYLSRLLSSGSFLSFRDKAKELAAHLPKSFGTVARKAEEYAKGFVTGGTLFEEMGFYYIGPVDGHNLDHLLPVLKNIRDRDESGPVLLHVVTKKGYGYAPAEASADKYHGVSKFDIATGVQHKTSPAAPAYTKVFAHTLCEQAEKDPQIVAVTAAMPSGTGLDEFAKQFPNRCFDVGIAEQHAVTFAAGLACEGLKPFVAIYSTFLQRGYDQVVHDVALQNLPVRFIIDRAGLVGADGATHAGAYDLAYLGCLPHMVIMAPSDELELKHMVCTAVGFQDGPTAIRFPRGEGVGVDLTPLPIALEIGKGRVVRQGGQVALLSLGCRLTECLKAAEQLALQGIQATVADARFAKPVDRELIMQLARHHPLLVCIEAGSIGGFSAQVFSVLSEEGLLDRGLKIRSMVLPDRFIDHDTPDNQYEQAGLTANHIARTVCRLLNQEPGSLTPVL